MADPCDAGCRFVGGRCRVCGAWLEPAEERPAFAVGQTWRGRSAPERTIVELVADLRPRRAAQPLIRYEARHACGPRRYLVTTESFAAWAEALVS